MKTFALTLLLLLAACDAENGTVSYQGYAEGDWIYLSAPQGGYLHTLAVERGAHAERGAPAYSLGGAQPATVADDALQAQVDAAASALDLAGAQQRRTHALERDHYAAPARTEETQTARALAAAQLQTLRQQQANQTGLIPESGEISEIYYRPGEWVPPGQPILSLLPDGRRRILFFVPETVVAMLHNGQRIEARCDGCDKPIPAQIDFIAAQAEYTPPVIYSQGSREKLVFRIEARPDAAEATRLRPGLPLEIRLP